MGGRNSWTDFTIEGARNEELRNRIEEVATQVAQQTGGSSVDRPEPASPFIVARREEKEGVYVTMAFRIPSNIDRLKIIIQELRFSTKPHRRMSRTVDDISDAARAAGYLEVEFPEPLRYNNDSLLPWNWDSLTKNYGLIRLVGIDKDTNSKVRTPTADPAAGVYLVQFDTGPASWLPTGPGCSFIVLNQLDPTTKIYDAEVTCRVIAPLTAPDEDGPGGAVQTFQQAGIDAIQPVLKRSSDGKKDRFGGQLDDAELVQVITDPLSPYYLRGYVDIQCKKLAPSEQYEWVKTIIWSGDKKLVLTGSCIFYAGLSPAGIGIPGLYDMTLTCESSTEPYDKKQGLLVLMFRQGSPAEALRRVKFYRKKQSQPDSKYKKVGRQTLRDDEFNTPNPSPAEKCIVEEEVRVKPRRNFTFLAVITALNGQTRSITTDHLVGPAAIDEQTDFTIQNVPFDANDLVYHSDTVGGFMYVTSVFWNNELSIWDVSVPAAPVLKSTYALGASPGKIRVSGSYAYTYTNTDFHSINVSNPLAPAAGGSCAIAAGTVAIRVSGSYAYLLSLNGGGGAPSKLQIIDISTPTAPVLRSTLLLGNTSASDLLVSGNTAYITGATGLDVVNVTVKTAPVLVTTLAIGASTGITNNGNSMYVANGNLLKTYSIATPTAPSLLGSTDLSSEGAGGGLELQYTNSILYFTAGSNIFSYEVTDPDSLTQVGTVNTTVGGGSRPGHGLTVIGDYAYWNGLQSGTGASGWVQIFWVSPTASIGNAVIENLTVQNLTAVNGHFTGDVEIDGGLKVGADIEVVDEIKLMELPANGSSYVSHKAPASLAGNSTYIWPSALPGSTLFLQSDASGNLTWGTPATSVTVREADGTPSFAAATIEFDQADGFVLTNSSGVARLDLSGIPLSKLAALTASKVVVTNGSGEIVASSVASSDIQNATKLQSRDLDSAAPVDGYAIVWDQTNSIWKPGLAAGGSGTGGTGIDRKTGDAITRRRF